jgi:probable F420-dependent oxidoreductase
MSSVADAPQLSIQLRTFADEAPADGWRSLLDGARAADAAGIDRVLVSDHVVMGEHLDAYGDPARGGTVGGRQPTGPDGHWLDPLAVLAHLAALTERVRLGTNILIAALRRPVVLAGQASTIDVLSGGRLDLGVGVGWQAEEYEAAGLDYHRRGRLLDHTLEVCRTLWTEPLADLDSPELRFERIHQQPKPLAPGGVPIWVSGTVQPASMRRLARFGSGWIPWGDDAADVAAGIARMRAAVAELGRDPAELGVVGTLRVPKDGDGRPDPEAAMAGVEPLLAAGVTDVRLSMGVPADQGEATDLLGRAVTAFRAAAT